MYYQVHRLQIKTNGKKPPQSHQSVLLSLGQWSWMVRSYTMYSLHTQFTAPVVCIHYTYIFCQLLFTSATHFKDKRFALNKMLQRNARNFSIFYVYGIEKCMKFFSFVFDFVQLYTFLPYEYPDLCQHRPGHFIR